MVNWINRALWQGSVKHIELAAQKLAEVKPKKSHEQKQLQSSL